VVRDEWRAGRLAAHHLDAAAAALGDPDLAVAARAVLDARSEPVQPTLQRLALVTDVRDLTSDPVPGRTWTDLVVHQIGQHCAAMFDEWQATWAPDHGVGLFPTWRVDPSVTHGFAWPRRQRVGTSPARRPARRVADRDRHDARRPRHPRRRSRGVPDRGAGIVNGWAAWCASRRWQARLAGGDDDAIVDLLAIRLAWEWLLAADVTDGDADQAGDAGGAGAQLEEWAASWAHVDALVAETADEQRIDWVLQAATERTYQDTIIRGLPDATGTSGDADVQAVFCIDVRSEVFRRALETTAATVRTRGFAGFFGLPIAYTPAGSALTRPQLPGLLAPTLHVSEAAATTGDPAELWAERAAVLDDRRGGGRSAATPRRSSPSSSRSGCCTG
jgi:uncharacterized protein YbcC (UPF0753/DUF2309 family)